MSVKAGFSADEWATLEEAPLLAGARVIAAERGGTLRESFAVAQVYKAARELRGESALLDDLVADSPSIDLNDMREVDDPVAASNHRLRAALALLEARTSPEEVSAYKGFVLAVAQTAAEANREGGFAGIGGEEVSASEQAALDEIHALMGVQPGEDE
jgi:hypothetical protein